jgi:hypothetical protein
MAITDRAHAVREHAARMAKLEQLPDVAAQDQDLARHQWRRDVQARGGASTVRRIDSHAGGTRRRRQ